MANRDKLELMANGKPDNKIAKRFGQRIGSCRQHKTQQTSLNRKTATYESFSLYPQMTNIFIAHLLLLASFLVSVEEFNS
jgi:hypothetical protein